MPKVTINEDRCKGCALCVDACKKNCLAMAKEKLNGGGYHPCELIDEAACISCAMCAIMCPDAAIKVEK